MLTAKGKKPRGKKAGKKGQGLEEILEEKNENDDVSSQIRDDDGSNLDDNSSTNKDIKSKTPTHQHKVINFFSP